MVRRRRSFVWCGGWYFHFRVVNFSFCQILYHQFFSIVASSSNLAASIMTPTMLLTFIFSIYYSIYVSIVEIFFSWSMRFDEKLFVVSFCNVVSSERRSVSGARFTSTLLRFFNYSRFLKYFFGLIKNVLDCSVKEIFLHKWWWWCSNCGGFSRWSDVISGSRLCVYVRRHNE